MQGMLGAMHVIIVMALYIDKWVMCRSSQNGQILYSLSELVSGLDQAIDIYNSIRSYICWIRQDGKSKPYVCAEMLLLSDDMINEEMHAVVYDNTLIAVRILKRIVPSHMLCGEENMLWLSFIACCI